MKRAFIILFIFLLLGASAPKSQWENWSQGVSLRSSTGRQKIKFYHKTNAFSTISISESVGGVGNPDNVAIFLDHSSKKPFIQVVDPRTGKPKYIDLLKLADFLNKPQEEDRLPWGDRAPAGAVAPKPISSSNEQGDE